VLLLSADQWITTFWLLMENFYFLLSFLILFRDAVVATSNTVPV